MMGRVGDTGRNGRIFCSTGQSPQWAVVPVEEEEEGGGGGREEEEEEEDIASVAFLILHDRCFVFGMYWVRISNVSCSLDYSPIFKFLTT
jgi:hypothetical protein